MSKSIRVLAIFFLFVVFGICRADSAVQINKADLKGQKKLDKANLMFDFTDRNKHIWIMNASESDIQFIEQTSRTKTSVFGNDVKIEITGDIVMRVRSTEIRATGSQVYIDGQSMGRELNAVVDSKGRVKFGAFIRNFD